MMIEEGGDAFLGATDDARGRRSRKRNRIGARIADAKNQEETRLPVTTDSILAMYRYLHVYRVRMEMRNDGPCKVSAPEIDESASRRPAQQGGTNDGRSEDHEKEDSETGPNSHPGPSSGLTEFEVRGRQMWKCFLFFLSVELCPCSESGESRFPTWIR